jgi:biotin operon repressor
MKAKKKLESPTTISADEIREDFRAKLPTIRTGANALSYFVDICTAWIEGVLVALHLATRRAPTEPPIILDDLLRDVEGCFGKRWKQARSDLLVKARDAGYLEETKPLVESVIRGLRALIETAAAPAVVLGSPSKRRPSLLAVRQQLLSDLDELTAMRRLLRSQLEERPLLTDQQKCIWELLDGQALSAKEIAKRPGCPASEESVRRQIKKMRRNGYDIQNIRSRGYYRKDAPPPDSP